MQASFMLITENWNITEIAHLEDKPNSNPALK